MAQAYLDTSIRRTPVRFYSRTITGATTNGGRAKQSFTVIENVSLTNFKTRGGTEIVVDGMLSIISTAKVTLQYRTDVKRGDKLECLADSSFWEILDVENVDMQNRDVVLTVRNCEGVS